MNLVGHIAVALRGEEARDVTQPFLVGCVLPDLAAIARVRFVMRPGGEMGRGVQYHHACDAVFHESQWFNDRVVTVRDELMAAGIDRGPARACAHAGLEMVLDGALVADADVRESARSTLRSVGAGADEVVDLAPVAQRSVWRERVETIGASLEPARYAETRFVAERLHRMTAGRRRIELRIDDVAAVESVLQRFEREIEYDADDVVAHVSCAAGAAAIG